jgi:hypothetical protein
MSADSDNPSATGSSSPVPAGVRVFPNVWPGDPLPVQPGDAAQFAPMGFCMDVPIMMRPWDTLESALTSREYYGAQPHTFHPLLGAPRTEARGGVIYFDTGETRDSLLAALRIMGVSMRPDWRDFAVFVAESSDPQKDGYIVHCRIMPFSTVMNLYRANPDLVEGGHTPQPVSVQDVLWGFVEGQERRWGTGMGGALSGCMGGDGDWAKESLCFGFMVENAYHMIFRIWSRAELVTK